MQGFSGVTMQMQALAARLPASPERAHVGGGRRRRRALPARGAALGGRPAQRGRRRVGPGRGHRRGRAADHRNARHPPASRLAHGPAGLATDVEYDLLRIAQEALANAVKHATPARSTSRSNARRRQIRLSIHDDGVGFNVDGEPSLPGHYGLIGMRERASRIGAELRIRERTGKRDDRRAQLADRAGRRAASNGAGQKLRAQSPRARFSGHNPTVERST